MPTRAAALCLTGILMLAGPAAAEMQRFTVETGQSRAGFDAFHTFQSFSLASEAPTGEIQADIADLKQPIRGQVVVPAASLRSADKKRDRAIHRTLDAEHQAEIRYQIDKVESSFTSLAENNDVLLTIRGVLTMRGESRPVDFSGRVRLRPGGALWVRGESWIKPRDWGVLPIRIWLISVREAVLVTFDLVLNKAQ
jgi:polyisoprenoid-binding protein YceI